MFEAQKSVRMREHNVNNFAKMPTDTQIVLRARKLGADLPMPQYDDDEDDIGELTGGTNDDHVDDASGEGDDDGCQEDCEEEEEELANMSSGDERDPKFVRRAVASAPSVMPHDTFKGYGFFGSDVSSWERSAEITS